MQYLFLICAAVQSSCVLKKRESKRVEVTLCEGRTLLLASGMCCWAFRYSIVLCFLELKKPALTMCVTPRTLSICGFVDQLSKSRSAFLTHGISVVVQT